MKRILLIDDEAVRVTFRKDLELANYAVTTVTNGEEALAILNHGQYDLVITDLVMPGINGIKVLQETKKLHPDTGVFILTGYGDMTSAIEALRLGADDYLLKPCDVDELLMRMSRCLEKQDLQKKVKIYENILPVCMYCKNIRDDANTEPGKGRWMSMEEYLYEKSRTAVSHGCCPACYVKHKDEWGN